MIVVARSPCSIGATGRVAKYRKSRVSPLDEMFDLVMPIKTAMLADVKKSVLIALRATDEKPQKKRTRNARKK